MDQGFADYKDETQIRLAYLFLSSEHKISDDDFALFEEMGKSIKGFSEKKGDITKDCEDLKPLPATDGFFPTSQSFMSSETAADKSRFEIISEIFSAVRPRGNPRTLAGRMIMNGGFKVLSFRTMKPFSSDRSEDANNRRDILWTLISLQYRSKEKTEKRQRLIDLWAQANLIDKAVVSEMWDICETQNAIIGCQKWLETTGKSCQEADSIRQELEKDLKSLLQSVSGLILLGNEKYALDKVPIPPGSINPLEPVDLD